MEIKYTKHFLNKLEDLMSETDYILRYEKGNFQSGYCIIKDSKVAVINKYFSLEGKINSLIEIIHSVVSDTSSLSAKNEKFYSELIQTKIES